ncbi:AI-2E family transporter [Gammaproteobacteria bacterium]|nr:AI-2E family transporter [Gammaproteobacteria bacterium]
MSDPDPNQPLLKARVVMFAVGLATLVISALFIGMIRDFLMALLLAAIFSAMTNPLYRKVLDKVGGRSGVATAVTLIILLLGVLIPTLGLVYVAATQASDLTGNVVSFVESLNNDASGFSVPEWVPFREEIQGAAPQIASKVGELTGKLAGFFVSSLSAATKGTASFFMSLFVMIYAMVYFLQERTSVLAQLVRYSGLPPAFQVQLVDRVVSISRATIKGTLLIGIAQGMLGGIGFWVVDIPAAAFWGAVMMIVSVIPGIGPTLVWVPGVIYLFATGETVSAIGLALWCGLVVSTIDNVMRPALVGKDTQMPDLLVLVSTLGGLVMFGAVGLIIGPVIAGLFLTMWDLFQAVFGDLLPGGPTDDPGDSPEQQP